jgi:tetratricopeptide (TPR) repeat protein
MATGGQSGQPDEPKTGKRQPITPAARKRLQKCFEHASKQTTQDNYDYATELLTQCVVGDPSNVLYVRSYIENLQKKYGNNKKGAPLAQFKELGARSALKKAIGDGQWDEAVKHGLKILAVNPWDIPTLRSLATAAQNSAGGEWASGDGECELYYLKCALEAGSKEVETNKQCARAMAERGQYDQAIACWHRVEQALPGNEEAQKAISELAVKKTLSRFEDPAKKAAARGQAGPAAQAQEELPPDEVLRRRLAQDPKDLPAYYELAQIYLNADKYKEAEQVYAEALEATDGDPDVQEKWEDVQVRRLRHYAAQARARRKESEDADREYRRLRKELNEAEIKRFQHLCDRYPNILRYKYDLGVQYQIGRQHNEAIKQFQAARNDPRCKGLCFLGMGQCFQAIKQKRLAMQNYEAAVAEIPDRDAQNKKEALYLAGKMALEDMGDLTVAERHLTALAGMDFTYKDVSALLDKIAGMHDNKGPEAT